MNNIINLVSCVVCEKLGLHWLCHTCEKRIHHPSVWNKVEEHRKKIDRLVNLAKIANERIDD